MTRGTQRHNDTTEDDVDHYWSRAIAHERLAQADMQREIAQLRRLAKARNAVKRAERQARAAAERWVLGYAR
jgi:hypothetical protein